MVLQERSRGKIQNQIRGVHQGGEERNKELKPLELSTKSLLHIPIKNNDSESQEIGA